MAMIYCARKRMNDLCWDYTAGSDEEGGAHPVGACAKNKCFHKTEQEAEDHQRRYECELIQKAARVEIDTKKGHKCYVKDCAEPAFFAVQLPHFEMPFDHNIEGCQKHLDYPIRGRVDLSKP